MKRMVIPGLVALVLVLAVGVFVYFSPGIDATTGLLDTVKVQTPGWKDAELKEVLVDLQHRIQASHPRLRRFRIVYLEKGAVMRPRGEKISLSAGTYGASECLNYVAMWSGNRITYDAGWVALRPHSEGPKFPSKAYVSSYVWPGRPPAVDEMK